MTTRRTGKRHWRRALKGLLALLACGVLTPADHAASFAEPSTVFYGKVTGTGSAQPFLITEGELRWTIRRADGSTLPLRTKLRAVNGGEFCYRLDVPQQALLLGLTPTSGTLPLKASDESNAVAEILVNGKPARIAAGGSGVFTSSQVRRASTLRVDLEVAIAAPDTDHDGLPDAWEKQFGGDLDPNGDPDGDGRSNLAEYRAGTHPLQDSRHPSVATRQVQAYADSTTGVILRATDSNASAETVVFKLTQLPAGAEVRLRNVRPDPANPDEVLALGATFTQRDVLNGRLVLVQAGGALDASSFAVTVRDSAPGSETAPASISVSFYKPSPELAAKVSPSGALPAGLEPGSDEARRLSNYILGKERGVILWDGASESADLAIAAPSATIVSGARAAEYAQQFGVDRPQAFLGGRGRDTFAGGVGDDVLSGGDGDNVLTGGPGADRFVVGNSGPGTDTITDFQPEEGDVLDLDGVLWGVAGKLSDHVRLVGEASAVRVEIRRAEDPSVAPDRVVTLAGLAADRVDLSQWVDHGNLVAGALVLPVRISVAAGQSMASENGPRNGEFLLTRSGSADKPVVVRLALRGSAVNGVDFATVPSSVTLAAGEREARIAIQPYADSQPEPAETVELVVESGDGYEIAESGRASVTIADLLPVVRIEVLDLFATSQPAAPATVLISRDTVIDRSVLVRVDLRGSASNGADYQWVSRFVNLAPGQTSALIPITPMASAGPRAPKSVWISVVSDPAYLVAGPSVAEVLMVPERTSFAAWKARYFPTAAGTLAAFGAADAGGTGVPNLFRYAFGLDPVKPDAARLPKAVLRDGHLTLEVGREVAAEDVEFLPEVSSDLKSWSQAPDRVERVFLPENAGSAEVLSFRVIAPVEAAPQIYLRLRVKLRQ